MGAFPPVPGAGGARRWGVRHCPLAIVGARPELPLAIAGGGPRPQQHSSRGSPAVLSIGLRQTWCWQPGSSRTTFNGHRLSVSPTPTSHCGFFRCDDLPQMHRKDGGCSSSMCGGHTSPLGMPPSSPISSAPSNTMSCARFRGSLSRERRLCSYLCTTSSHLAAAMGGKYLARRA